MKHPNSNKTRGFTLIELMIAVSLLALVIGMSTSAYIQLIMGAASATQCSEMHSTLRHTMDVMSRDLYATTNVLTRTATYLEISKVVAGGGVQSVVYSYDPTTEILYRKDATTSYALAEGITGMTCILYQQDGVSVTPTEGNAYSIDVLLTAQADVRGTTFDDLIQTRILFRNKR
jgi:prepilin-type N-terminal cleavage/methylation domain-containing protein